MMISQGCLLGTFEIFIFKEMDRQFTHKERLKGLKTIENLFDGGQSFIAYPFRIVFLKKETLPNDEAPVRVLISVPKKRFKKAVDRNRIKRLIREAYRLNKTDINQFVSSQNSQILVAFQYVSNDILKFDAIEQKMILALNKLMKQV